MPLEVAVESGEASLKVLDEAKLVLGGAAGARLSLRLVWPDQVMPAVAKRLQELGLLSSPAARDENCLMILDIGGEARAKVQGAPRFPGF